VGQKDDTRENSCVTETKREGKTGGKGRKERDGFTESEKPHTRIDILCRPRETTHSRVSVVDAPRRLDKVHLESVLLCDRQNSRRIERERRASDRAAIAKSIQRDRTIRYDDNVQRDCFPDRSENNRDASC